MKILILYTYNKGLLSEFFQELSEKLFADGFGVINFFLKHKKEYFIQNGVEIYGEKRRGFIANYWSIYKIINQTKPDVIISNFSYINPAILFGKLLKVKRNIAWFHTAYGHTKPSRLKVVNKTFYLNMADIVIANSRFLQEEMQMVYKVPKQKTRRVPFWTNIANYSSKTKPLLFEENSSYFKIGCPGRLESDKNHQLVIETLHQIKLVNRNQIKLFIAGAGSYESELKQLVKKLGLNEQVVFLGSLNVNDMVKFYEHMDVLVLPSLHEAFGLVFIEAIALGRPVIVSSQFGALNFIDTDKFSVDSFTFNPESKEELKIQLMAYINQKGFSPEYFKTLYANTFEKEVIYNKIKSIIIENVEG